MGNVLGNEYSVSIWDDEKTLEMESGDSYTMTQITKCHWTVQLEVINFMEISGKFHVMYVLPQFLKMKLDV